MGAVGALVGGDDLTGPLRRALAVSEHRGSQVAVHPIGRFVIGCLSHLEEDGWSHVGSRWVVALAGRIDKVGGVDHPSDPAQALASLMERVGVVAVDEIRGDFAGVATDGERLIGFRDHLGTDGLFFGTTGSTAALMSEPKQVLSALGRARRPDVDGLVALYFSQAQADDEVPSALEGVDRIPRAALVEAGAGGWRQIGRVWNPESVVESSSLSVEEAAEAAWSLIGDVVDRAVTDSTAVSLSGGIDSTLIAAVAAPRLKDRGERLGSMSAVYPHAPSVDESDYIKSTVDFLDLDSQTYVPTRDRLDQLDVWVDRFDGPTFGLAIGAVEDMNQAALRFGYSTLLGGEMAELVYDLREHALARMLWRGAFPTAWTHIRGLRERNLAWFQILKLVAGGIVPSSVGTLYRERRRPIELPAAWLDPSYMPGLTANWDMRRPARRRWPDIQEYFVFGPTSPGLEVVNIMGETAGVRTRRPLADRDVWEFFLSLPPEIKFPDAHTKALVRRVLDGKAPDEVVWRTDKTVFNEDSMSKADYSDLTERLNNGFRLPGVDYSTLNHRLEEGSLGMWELWMARTLASIHAFVAVTA